MKRIVLFLALLSATAVQAQIKQITGGGYQNSNGVACSGCILYLQLPVDATVTGTGQIVPNLNSYTLDANGNVPANSNLWANDQLTPSGLTYKATLTNAGGGRIWGPEFLSITGVSPISLTQLVPVASSSVFLSNPAVLTGNNAFTGTNTHTGGEYFTKLDGRITFVDAANSLGWAAPFIQSAINSLPVLGGTVYVNCGDTLPGPTSIPSGVRLVSTCASTGGLNSVSYSTHLTYTANLTIGPARGIEIKGIFMDFSSTNNTGLTFTSLQYSSLDMSVNCESSTEPSVCVNFTATNAGGNTAWNTISKLSVLGGTTAIQLTAPTSPAAFVTLNHFGTVITYQDLIAIHAALDFVQQCDSNIFDEVHVNFTGTTPTASAIIFNDTGTPTVDSDADTETINWVDFTGNTVTGAFYVVNASIGNNVRDGFGLGQFSPILNIANNTIGAGTFFRTATAGGSMYAKSTYCFPQTPGQTLAGCVQGPASINGQLWTMPTITGTIPVVVASGTAAMPTSSIAAVSGTTITCSAAAGNPFTATNVLTSDTIIVTPNASPSNPNGGLIVQSWPTAGGVNFEYCNPTASALTPVAETLNWRVVR